MSICSSSRSSRSSSPAISSAASTSRAAPRGSSTSSMYSQRHSFSSASASTTTTTSNPYSACAYPSWPSGSALRRSSAEMPSAYVSDEDLFGDDDAYLSEPPPPPRPAEAYLARPLLPPVVQCKPRQYSTGNRKKRHSVAKSKD